MDSKKGLCFVLMLLLINNAVSQIDTIGINKYMDEVIEDYEIFGGAVAIVVHDHVVYKRHFGISNLETRKKVDNKTLFQLFSTTKIFSSTAIHKLMQTDLLSLEDPINHFLKDLPSTWHNIKIKHLLSHSSGLPDIRFYSEEKEEDAKIKVYNDPIQFMVGDQFEYNQTNYWLLDRIVKKVTNVSITNLIASEQFEKYGKSIVFDGCFSNVIHNRAVNYAGYGPNGKREIAEYNIAEFLHGASGLNVSLDAFIRWDENFSKGKILNKSSKQKLFKQFDYKNSEDFGYGWDIINLNGTLSYGFTSSGFTGYRKFPHKNVSIIFLTNGSMRQMPINQFINKLMNLVTNVPKEKSDKELIMSTINDYLEGTAEGEPDRLINAFHKDMNLYSIDNDSLKVLSGKTYTGYYRPGQKRNRIGKVISIDYENDAAMAKLEIDYPIRSTLYTDYLLLLKIRGRWKIIHKAYTSKNY